MNSFSIPVLTILLKPIDGVWEIVTTSELMHKIAFRLLENTSVTDENGIREIASSQQLADEFHSMTNRKSIEGSFGDYEFSIRLMTDVESHLFVMQSDPVKYRQMMDKYRPASKHHIDFASESMPARLFSMTPPKSNAGTMDLSDLIRFFPEIPVGDEQQLDDTEVDDNE